MEPNNDPKGKAGGDARARKLSAEKRKEIAARGALARWSKDLPKATHHGMLTVGETETQIPCFVLNDGRRVISGRGLTTAIGMKGRGQGVSRISSHKLISSLEMNDLVLAIENPIKFVGRSPQGIDVPSDGYEAIILQRLCDAILVARDKGLATTEHEKRYVHYADVLIRSFAKVGIIALVDEATGYQYDRAKNALAKILEQFIAKELQPWTRTFPLDFYAEIFRLKHWPFDPATMQSPRVLGKYTNNIVYERLAPDVLKYLREKNPVVDGRRKNKHFQWLTGEIGHPKLLAHLEGVKMLMKVSDSWEEFLVRLDKYYPIHKPTELGFDVEVSRKPKPLVLVNGDDWF